MKKLLIVILICLILPISVLAVTYGKTGESTNFNGDVGVPSGSGYYINGAQVTSGMLSDVASIAMLDENESVAGFWTFAEYLTIVRASDFATSSADLYLRRLRDGDPTSNVSSGDNLGEIVFLGYHTDGYDPACEIRGTVDGTPGAIDMPGRLEFWTTLDNSITPVLRMAIDNAGNIKMGDGVWTNYVKITSGGVLTPEGSATVTATNLVPTVEIDAGAHTIGFTMQTDSGTGNQTIDWRLGNKMQFTIGAATTFIFTAPTNPCNLILEIIQDGTGGRDIIWPGTVKWLGTEPTWTDGGIAKTIVVAFWYNGTNYWAQGTPWEE